MPLYDYICKKCGHQVEVMHSVHGHGPSACPNCGGDMKKAVAAPAVHFKGTGWARKDRSSSSGSGKPSSSESASGSDSSPSGSGKPSSSDSPSSGESSTPAPASKDGD